MARKKSVKIPCDTFNAELDEIEDFIDSVSFSSSQDLYTSWTYEAAIIRVYRSFELLMLEVLVAAVNRDPSEFSNNVGVDFPGNITDEVSQYLITNGGYFDFKGRSNLIDKFRKYVGVGHVYTTIVSDLQYMDALDKLTLRNYAAHGSHQSKRSGFEGSWTG